MLILQAKPVSAEFSLLAACCRPPGPERDSAVRAMAADAVEWPKFEALLTRHRVEGLAHEALRMAGVAPPEPLAERLRHVALRVGAEALRGGRTARTLSADALFAYLCVHGSAHSWSRLKWLADLGALWAGTAEPERVGLYRRARAFGAGHCPAAAVLLCETVLGIALPGEIAGEVRANPAARRLASLALGAMTGGAREILDRPLMTERIILSGALFAERASGRIAELSRLSVSLDDRLRVRLPRALRFLYAFLRAPLWISRRLRRRGWPGRPSAA